MTDLFALLLAAQHGGGTSGKTVKWSSITANNDGTFTATDSEGVDHTLSYTADAAGKITAITLDGVTKTVTYDADGNITAIGSTDVDLNDMPAVSDYDLDVEFRLGTDDSHTVYQRVGINLYGGARNVPINAPVPNPPIPYGKRFFKGWGYDWSTTSVVSFPIQATTPASLYAIFLDSYRYELYEFFEIDAETYPYVFISCNYDVGDHGYIYLYFSRSYQNVDNQIWLPIDSKKYDAFVGSAGVADPSELADVVRFLKANYTYRGTTYEGTTIANNANYWCYGSEYKDTITVAAHYDDI